MTHKTEITKQRYNRLAPFYDVLESLMEVFVFKQWRERIWHKTDGNNILEVGVGTGKNFIFYPENSNVTAIDFSEEMLARAKIKAEQQKINVNLQIMDVEALDYPDNSFDTVVATFVFCSVPDPMRGLDELYRVCKAGGKLLLVEHVVSSRPLLAFLMNCINPLIAAIVGANINRDTVANVQRSPFICELKNVGGGDIIKLIEAKKPR